MLRIEKFRDKTRFSSCIFKDSAAIAEIVPPEVNTPIVFLFSVFSRIVFKAPRTLSRKAAHVSISSGFIFPSAQISMKYWKASKLFRLSNLGLSFTLANQFLILG